jgi:hypothetical protein
VSILASELNVKRLEILHEFVPQARRIAVLAARRRSRPASSSRAPPAISA